MRTIQENKSTMVAGSLCRGRSGLHLVASVVLGLSLVLGVVLVVGARGRLASVAVDGGAVQASDAMRWLSETVDSDGWVGEYASLAMDGDGNPHVSYYDTIPYRLKYARKSGMVWTIEVVDDYGRPGLRTSLALEPVSPYTPHVSYHDFTSQDLRYARRTLNGWMTETVATKVGAYGSSLALAPASPYTPHIAYYDSNGDALIHAWLSGTTWFSEVVESRPGYVAGYVSLALAPASPYTPHISYQDGPPIYYDLKHAWRTSTGWLSETVDSKDNVGEYSSIALEPTPPYTPHIGYYKGAFYIDDLKHAWRTPSGWLSETVDATGDVGKYSSLALEPTAPYTPHIAYLDDTNDDLRHAWWTPGGWLTETVDSEGDVGKHCSLALNPMQPHAPHIAYFDDTNNDLKHSWFGREVLMYLPLVLWDYSP